MNILVLDNYDSFTYNLVYLINQLGVETTVRRNDKIEPHEATRYDAIVLSPGPGLPKDAGLMSAVIEHCAGKLPILGICLGHQAIAEYLGAELLHLEEVYHGVQSAISINKNTSPLFNGLPDQIEVGRYHSWVVDPFSATDRFTISARENETVIMAIENTTLALYGLQFHPESVLTPDGKIILKNFLDLL